MGKLLPGKIPEWSLDKIVWKKWQHGSCYKREMLHTSTGIPRSNTCLSNSRLENLSKQVSKISDFKLAFSIEERSPVMLNCKNDYVVVKAANYPRDNLIFEYFSLI